MDRRTMRRTAALATLVVAVGAAPVAAGGLAIVDGAQIGGADDDSVYAMATTDSELYVAGIRDESGSDTSGTGFVLRVSSSGSTVWTHLMDTAGADEYDAVVERGDAVYAAGWTKGFPSDPTHAPRADYDAFVERLRKSDGQRVWVHRIHTSGNDFGEGLAVDATGLYLGGMAGDAIAGCTPDPCPFLGSGADAFLRRYTFDGSAVWTREFGTTAYDTLSEVDISGGHIYVGGITLGVLEVGHVPTGDNEGYVRRYDATGSVAWTRQFGPVPTGFMSLQDLSANGDGVYVVGHLTKGLSDVAPHVVSGPEDAYVRMFGPSGSIADTRQFGGGGTDSAGGVVATSTAIFVTGDTDTALFGTHHAGDDGWARRYATSASGLTAGWTFQWGTDSDDAASRVAHNDVGTYLGGDTGGTVPHCTPACSPGGDFDAYWLLLR